MISYCNRLIKSNDTLTISEIASKLTKENSTIKKVIKLLKDNGLIKRIGNNRIGHGEITKDKKE